MESGKNLVETDKMTKQDSIGNSLEGLRASIERLEKFVKRVKNNNEPEPQEGKDSEKAQVPSLAVFITSLPEIISVYEKRIGNAVEELTELLY